MAEPKARLELVRPFKNPSCPYCTGLIPIPPREQRRAGNANMTEARAEELDLRGPRHAGWFLHLILHGLREETQTLEMVLRLEGAVMGTGVPTQAYVVAPRFTRDGGRLLFGSSASPPQADDPSPIICVGKKLVMGLDFVGRQGTGLTVLPIAHLFHWFNNPSVG